MGHDRFEAYGRDLGAILCRGAIENRAHLQGNIDPVDIHCLDVGSERRTLRDADDPGLDPSVDDG
jgi:hypothetical protein